MNTVFNKIFFIQETAETVPVLANDDSTNTKAQKVYAFIHNHFILSLALTMATGIALGAVVTSKYYISYIDSYCIAKEAERVDATSNLNSYLQAGFILYIPLAIISYRWLHRIRNRPTEIVFDDF